MRERAVTIEGDIEVVADLQGAAKTAGVRASRALIKHGGLALHAAKRTVPVRSTATRRSLALTAYGSQERPMLGDTDIEVGAVALPGRGLSAAGWLAHGTSRRGPSWDFYGSVDAASRGLIAELKKLAGDI